MSIWDRIQELMGTTEVKASGNAEIHAQKRDASLYAFVDTEVGIRDHKVHDIGAVRHDGAVYHGASKGDLIKFLDGVDFLCGHNIVRHDAKYLFGEGTQKWQLIDTLYVSPLLFPEHPYHKLLKDEKLQTDELNNPVNDCHKARDLFMEEVAAWRRLPQEIQTIYAVLLRDKTEFARFLEIALGSAFEVESQLILCYDLGYVTEDVLNYVEPKVTEIQKQLTGLIRTVKPV